MIVNNATFMFDRTYLESCARISMPFRSLFLSEIGEFQKIVGGFIDMVDTLAKEVEKEKMKVRFLVWISVCTKLCYHLGDTPCVYSLS